MLTNILPGLRELRAPLAAGFLWIALVLVLIGIAPFTEPERGSILDEAKTIVTGLGTSLLIGVLFFAAYVIGLCWQTIWSGFLPRLLAFLARLGVLPLESFENDGQYFIMSRQTASSFRSILRAKMKHLITTQSAETNDSFIAAKEKFDREVGLDKFSDHDSLFGGPAVRAMTGPAVYDLVRLVPARIMGDKQETWNAWDRLQAESEFRTLVAVPILALSVALSITESAWWALLSLAAVTLVFSGFRQSDLATSNLVEAVRVEKAQLMAGNALPSIHWDVEQDGSNPPAWVITAHIAEPRIT